MKDEPFWVIGVWNTSRRDLAVGAKRDDFPQDLKPSKPKHEVRQGMHRSWFRRLVPAVLVQSPSHADEY